MPGEDTAKRFDEVSHLFLSSRESQGTPSRPAAEVTLWLAVHGQSYNRALVAAGVAGAFSRLGVRCTLLEIGEGLPNAGYYFALEPGDYLAPTLDGSRAVAGRIDSHIRFVYARDAGGLKPFDTEEAGSDAPHVIVMAFRHSLEERNPISLSGVAAAAGRFSRDKAGNGWRAPDGVVVFVDARTAARNRGIDACFRIPYPEAVVFVAERKGAADTGGDVKETVLYPRELLREWGRRSPPADPFFTDLATRYLQVLSHRRRKGERHAAI